MRRLATPLPLLLVAPLIATTTRATVDTSPSGDITVFAAASLTDAFTAIGDAFTTAHPDSEVTFNFAASSDLAAQINEGAPVDVFASADQNNMGKLVAAERNAGEPVTFATNSLEIVVETGNPLGIDGVEDLANPELIVVTCDTEVPIGAYTQHVFDAAGIEVTPDSLEENVRGIVGKVVAGEADAGVVYATDVIAAGDDADGVEIPDELNIVAEYPIATVGDAPNPAGAAAFVEFVLGEEGQAILAEFGFGGPDAVDERASTSTTATVTTES
jgi:molybdate transport system substrate-binding protein